ncbi:transcription factor bHLH118-like [Olea europaea subsp. europaea]|uniref:Transcription factor bHLH118-like n=1 Tax=Olea europaea subsp. europaea TaxID=158383 RepID=A0A8S0QFE4_OLEEU|nr:transcription factor bHLH118-like [Olea europaea subsp. europaea]
MIKMFPFQHGDELVFEPPSVKKQEKILPDLIPNHTSNLNTSSWKKGQQRSSNIQENEGGSIFPESDIRKLIHRDVERQRRQGMANLYASLQSHVSPEYLKGKKSISNLLQEAVDYIINTKKNIKKLCLQRELKKLSNSNNLSADVGRSSSYLPNCLVTVNPFLDDVEILISSNFKGEEFPLSKVLKELLGRGFNVVNCVTTKANERSLHRIHCEVQFVGVIDVLQGLGLLLLCTSFTFYYSSFFQASNFKCNDLSGLQERLSDVINHSCETSTQRSSDKWVCVSS